MLNLRLGITYVPYICISYFYRKKNHLLPLLYQSQGCILNVKKQNIKLSKQKRIFSSYSQVLSTKGTSSFCKSVKYNTSTVRSKKTTRNSQKYKTIASLKKSHLIPLL